MTTRATGPEVPTAADRLRQVVVTACYLGCLVGSMIGVGAFGGTPIAEAAGGALSSEATYVAPASTAFSVWSLIYAGLAAFTLWQWLPGRAQDPRLRRLGYPVAGSMVLNAAWILVVQAGWVRLSVAVIAVLLVLLGWCFAFVVATRTKALVETVVVDGTVGAYLGWVCVATCANVAAALTAAGFEGAGLPESTWAVGVLATVAGIGVVLAVVGRGRVSVAATLVWGLAWIAVARSTGAPASDVVALAAGLAALVVVAATAVFRARALLRAAAHPHGAGQ